MVAPGASAHVHSHSRQLVPGARVGRGSGWSHSPCGALGHVETTPMPGKVPGPVPRRPHHVPPPRGAAYPAGLRVWLQQDRSPPCPRAHRGPVLPPHPPPWPGLSPPSTAPPGPQPRMGTDRIRVRTIQGAWPREGTASSIRGWVLTKLRISSGKALEALYCMPGAAQHPGLGGEKCWSGCTWTSLRRGSDLPADLPAGPRFSASV